VNALQKTLAIIALLVLGTQTVRHAYLLWLEPRKSVLDKYDRPLEDEISSAASLDELLRRYEPARKAADQARQERLKEAKEGKSDHFDDQAEPFKSERALHDAIIDWEGKNKEIGELRFFWFTGFVFLVIGLLSYIRLNRWLGVTLLIGAFSEFIYWTSPTFFGGHTQEFERLLVNKLAFSVVSLVLLVGVIWVCEMFSEKKQATAQ
jgi:hypothetical protein